MQSKTYSFPATERALTMRVVGEKMLPVRSHRLFVFIVIAQFDRNKLPVATRVFFFVFLPVTRFSDDANSKSRQVLEGTPDGLSAAAYLRKAFSSMVKMQLDARDANGNPRFNDRKAKTSNRRSTPKKKQAR